MLKKIYCLSICVCLYVDILYIHNPAWAINFLLHFPFKVYFILIIFKCRWKATVCFNLLSSLFYILLDISWVALSPYHFINALSLFLMYLLWLMKVDIQLNSNVIGILN